jgi:hypothetical protein
MPAHIRTRRIHREKLQGRGCPKSLFYPTTHEALEALPARLPRHMED